MARAAPGLLLAALLAGLLPGCLRWEARVVIEPDGSGQALAGGQADLPALRALAARVRGEAARLGLPVDGAGTLPPAGRRPPAAAGRPRARAGPAPRPTPAPAPPPRAARGGRPAPRPAP
ncbi:MAG: hypothetical protein ACKOSS_10480, partial [Planctomycetia bacterium]